MATFPHNLCGIRQDGHAEQHTPVVLRSEVERGMPRQRRTSADARVSVPCTLVFRSAAAAAEFEAWYYAEGFGWFDFTLPRTGTVVEARIVGGDIGGLTPITPAWNASERSITLEYIRPGFVQLPPGLHSVNPARLLGVQRNSTATYIDDAGVLQTAAANVLRYQGGQLLVEAAQTNKARRSEEFDNALWSKTNALVTANALAAPNGALAMDKLVATAVNDRHEVRSNGGAIDAVLPADPHTFSVFAAAGELRYMALLFTTGGSVGFDLLTGAVVGTPTGGAVASITPLASSVYRCAMTFTPTGASGALYICLRNTAGASVESFLGDGSSGLFAWGAQMEAGGLSSYIPTAAAAATRAADLITVAA